MRRTVSVAVCFILAGLYAGANAQIPENVQFQPGTYAVPYRIYQSPVPTAADAVSEETERTGDSQTEWEKKFNHQTAAGVSAEAFNPVSAPTAQPYVVPHLTYVYNHWTGRFHITPYEPGYAADPSAFPAQTSPLHVWISSKSSAAQPSPQVQYMSYYDPDPVILPAEIRLRGSRFFTPLTQAQPLPMPVPRPVTAEIITPPARTRLGERVRQNFAPFIVR